LRVVESFPHRVRVLEHVRIPMRDGVALSARIWLPEDAERAPRPAILEYIPYRKRDGTAARDALNHPYFAGHGYACVRVDLRGSGESEGVLRDEYLQSELDDGVEVLRWIGAQPWCDGQVGMIGISWGGFNGLQIAALQPPELKAVITVCSTDDRYADDVHYMGGCLLGDNLSWASVMFAYNSLPPDPALVGDRWRAMWRERLEESGLWLKRWLEHQRRDAYWEHGSICEDFSQVRCPVLAVSGWADGYSNAVFRLLEKLEVPRKGLVGPWSHKYPHLGVPGPAIGFLQECVRFWDFWLKGIENGAMDGPMLRAWLQDSVPPTTYYRHRPGRWIGEPAWPSPHIQPRRYLLAENRLLPEGDARTGEVELTVQSPLSVGLFAGKWCSYTGPPDLPHDQREEDGGALVFDTGPLAETLEILGSPEVELELSSSRPLGMVAVRLSDVAPDDKATRITYGLLNLAHRDGHAHPAPLEPGRRYRVRVQLNDVAQVFPAGHSIRLSISSSYWPLAWPPPESTRLTIYTRVSALTLPVRPPRVEDAALVPLAPPEVAPPLARTILDPGRHTWLVVRDLASDVSTLEVIKDDGIERIDELDLEVESRTTEWYTYEGGDFSSPRGEVYAVRGRRRKDWSIRTETRTILTCSPTRFFLHATLDAYENGARIVCRSWAEEIPRDHV
jgi:uncharacterized protein